MNADELKLQENHLFSALATGRYHEFLEPWLQQFKKDIKVVFFDDLRQDPLKLILDVTAWLQIDGRMYHNFVFDIKNKSMNYRNQALQQLAVSANRAGQRFWRNNPGFKKNLMSLYYMLNGTGFAGNEIDSETLNFLRDYYHPHNLKLQNLLSRYGINENRPAWLEPVNELA